MLRLLPALGCSAELQTKVRENFTITEEATILAFSRLKSVLVTAATKIIRIFADQITNDIVSATSATF